MCLLYLLAIYSLKVELVFKLCSTNWGEVRMRMQFAFDVESTSSVFALEFKTVLIFHVLFNFRMDIGGKYFKIC